MRARAVRKGATSLSTRTEPEVGTSTPMTRFTSVVLPQPEGPRRQRISPADTESEMSFSTEGASRRRGEAPVAELDAIDGDGRGVCVHG